ncbi:hypothetical protein B0O99DRAFT_589727 [Bisporella sp. PMI_857]|nr:hypothetical protein B0O99DRAFT_589727 [Bisporella sp. PMI_857]
MASSQEPTDQMVQQVKEMLGEYLNDNDIRLRLKANNNSVEAVVNEYFEDPNSTKYQKADNTWDPRLHDADRDGNYDTDIPNFQIHGPDEIPQERQSYLNFDGGASSRPSRVPSRAPSPMPELVDQDAELAKAIELSLQESQQESGITSFGPANRPDAAYDEKNWGMVLSSNSVTLSDPEPAYRKRELGVPAFLKPSKDGNFLWALLTIYHEIPLVRELFLDRLNILPNYGDSNEWWQGKAIQLSTMSENFPENPFKNGIEFKYELQRLMAFLDKTDRSYGSADALANLPVMKDTQNRKTASVEAAALDVYKELFQDSPEKSQKLLSRVMYMGREEQQSRFGIFEFDFPSDESTNETIYDLADDAIWPDPITNASDASNASYISHIAEVVGFRLSNWAINKKSGVKFPAVWYPDRYLKPARQAALEMRAKKPALHTKLKEISDLENKLTEYKVPGLSGQAVKVQDLLKTALQHEAGIVETDGADEDLLLDIDCTTKARKLSAQLVKLSESIDKKVKALNEEKSRCLEELRQLSKLYTEPSEDPDQPALHRYTLRGVCVDKSTMYVCRQAEPSLVDLDFGEEESKPSEEQWWRIHYAARDSNPVAVEKTTEERVLEAANSKSESGGPLVIYASDKAMQWESKPLPAALETFVKKDNSFFKREFPNESNSPPSSGPKSPGKRKFNERSEPDDDSPVRNRNHVTVTERELDDEPSDQSTVILSTEFDARDNTIMGVDPLSEGTGQEMQERSSLRMLAGKGARQASTIDHMDLDQVIEDHNVASESRAVREWRDR